MTDSTDRDVESPTPVLEKLSADGPVVVAPKSEMKRVESAKVGVKVAVLKLSDLRAPELTEAEKSERDRRRKAIRAGRHPDTGKRLNPGDRKTLKPGEAFEFQMYLDSKLYGYGPAYFDPFHRAMIEAEEYRRGMGATVYQTGSASNLNGAFGSVQKPGFDDPLWARSIRDEVFAAEARQGIDGVFSASAQIAVDHQLSVLNRQRLFSDPLLDPAFVSRITGGVNHDLMNSAWELHDPTALRLLGDMVDRAATTKIVEHWKFVPELPWASMPDREAALGFQYNKNLMIDEASRMLSVYGPTIAEQTHFLTEYRLNLGLFQIRGTDLGAFQGADLLARVALPTQSLPGFEAYSFDRVERLRAYGGAQIRELKTDFKREPNPVFVWKALRIAQSCGLDVPEWVLESLGDAADGICALAEEDTSVGTRTEAEIAGKALGFSQGGRGQPGWFARAKQLERDRDIYWRVDDLLSAQQARYPDAKPKLSAACDEAAIEFALNKSTVYRVYKRLRDYTCPDEAAED